MPENHRFCTFFVDHFFIGIEVRNVQEIIRSQKMTRVPLASPEIKGLINLRGQIVTAIDLRQRMDLGKRPEVGDPMNVVIQGKNDEVVSLLVDKIGDVIDVSEHHFEEPPETLQGPIRKLICGVYKLENRLMLVLDIAKTIDISSTQKVRIF